MAIVTLTSNETGANSLTDINANFVDLDTTKADLASPTFTGTPSLPTGTTAVTQTAGDNSTKIATTEFVAGLFTIETTAGVTHSLTTTAGQRVIVWVKGQLEPTGTTDNTITLAYNGVTKDTAIINLQSQAAGDTYCFAMMYTETPGAATQNITVTTSAGSLESVVIMVLKL
jgi:ethanolamine utilization microcompartment shell protein EutL